MEIMLWWVLVMGFFAGWNLGLWFVGTAFVEQLKCRWILWFNLFVAVFIIINLIKDIKAFGGVICVVRSAGIA